MRLSPHPLPLRAIKRHQRQGHHGSEETQVLEGKHDVRQKDAHHLCTGVDVEAAPLALPHADGPDMSYDVIVLGSGPGGYVAAIRASQLGLKTAIVEKEALGGICLNWGCIPTKALLKSAQVFEYINHAKDYGITVGEGKPTFPAIVTRSRDVAKGMSNGVQFLMKKNKIDVIMGTGTLKPGKKIEVKGADGRSRPLKASTSSSPPARAAANLPA
jgi:dihydrolipoamide dehydrogenase